MEVLVGVSFALISKYPEATWEHESKNINLEANSEEQVSHEHQFLIQFSYP